MTPDAGYLYLNAANTWPPGTFVLSDVVVDGAGALALMPAGTQYKTLGAVFGGPFQIDLEPAAWYRLRVDADATAPGVHLQLFTYTHDTLPPPFLPNSDDPFPISNWTSQPQDVSDVLIRRPDPRPYPLSQNLWIGCLLRGDGRATPTVQQMRVEYGRATYLKYLPDIYADDDRDPYKKEVNAQGQSRDLLERFLSLAGSVENGLDETITDLPLLFDPASVPWGRSPSWFGWLSSWLAWDMSQHWTEEEARRYLAQAFSLYRKRGTVTGLREYLRVYAGVDAHIHEPLQHAGIWSLGSSASLGFATMLADSSQDAVLDSTATLDRSRLSENGVCCPTVFGDVAHRFCVQVYCGQLSRPGAREEVLAILDREKPAHTQYELSVIEPTMRVGAQARVGIDAVIAAGPPRAQIGRALGAGVLSASAETCKGEGDASSQ